MVHPTKTPISGAPRADDDGQFEKKNGVSTCSGSGVLRGQHTDRQTEIGQTKSILLLYRLDDARPRSI